MLLSQRGLPRGCWRRDSLGKLLFQWFTYQASLELFQVETWRDIAFLTEPIPIHPPQLGTLGWFWFPFCCLTLPLNFLPVYVDCLSLEE